jgi:hypothetical protein
LYDLTQELAKNNFDPLKIFTLEFKRNETEFETHTILTAKKKTTA